MDLIDQAQKQEWWFLRKHNQKKFRILKTIL
jgi:hypothetical protein